MSKTRFKSPCALLFALPIGLIGCGGGGDTTIINQTVTTTPTPTVSTQPTTPTSQQEYTGPCGPSEISVPEDARAGFENVQVVETNCEYALDVATAWSRDYGSDCYGGCRKVIESIPCTFDGSKIVCAAARTEVRWEIAYLDAGS